MHGQRYASSSASEAHPPAEYPTHLGQTQLHHGPLVTHGSTTQTPKINSNRYLAVAVQQVYIGREGNIPMVASRVSICNYRGKALYDTYVRPTQPVTNYRAEETGLQPAYFVNAPAFHDVQYQVAELIKDKILVGYCLWHFLLVMGISHPAINTRDVALFLPFRKTLRSRSTIPLPTLVERLMARNVGCGPYEEPLEQARASLDLFRSTQDIWEGLVASGSWPSALPPSSYASCFT